LEPRQRGDAGDICGGEGHRKKGDSGVERGAFARRKAALKRGAVRGFGYYPALAATPAASK
jgi:hypothetical protein